MDKSHRPHSWHPKAHIEEELGYRKKAESTKKKSKHLGHYDTPTELGKKRQMDVKYVPIIYFGYALIGSRQTMVGSSHIHQRQSVFVH